MLNKRGAGVLLHISSLPSPYGIGVFDENARDFIDKIAQMDFKYWQVLPFNPTDETYSPYCSPSAFAGNFLFIDPKGLMEMGLVSHLDIEENVYDGSPYSAAFSFAYDKRLALLKKAFLNIDNEIKSDIILFEKKTPWLTDYAIFMSVKDIENGKPWWLWQEQHARYNECVKNISNIQNEIEFWKFVQYIFFKQWNDIKTYANKQGIAVIGDMPIYVAMDSVDVWQNTNEFLIDEKTLSPQKVSGVPPDYFSEDGQLWGNPIYNWKRMEENDFSWWISRLKNALNTYDIVRIDHFRAFASYWEVSAKSETAKVGTWKTGPGMKLFDKVFEVFGKAPIIAEDLGVFGQDVIDLLNNTGFPGMNVIQFGFDPCGDSSHLPHNTVKNSINYVGTHDNNTLLGWLWEANEEERRFALDYVGFKGDDWGAGGYCSPACRKIIETVWKSSSNIAVVSFQDMCGFGSDARMNTPGIAENNWGFRTTSQTLEQIDFAYYKKINNLFRRTYQFFEKDSIKK